MVLNDSSAVDEDVDIYKAEDVLWAISCRTNPADEVHIMPGALLHPRDISIPEVGDEYTVMRIGGKMAIDATKPPTWRAAERQKFSRVDPMGKGDPEIARILEQVRVPR